MFLQQHNCPFHYAIPVSYKIIIANNINPLVLFLNCYFIDCMTVPV